MPSLTSMSLCWVHLKNSQSGPFNVYTVAGSVADSSTGSRSETVWATDCNSQAWLGCRNEVQFCKDVRDNAEVYICKETKEEQKGRQIKYKINKLVLSYKSMGVASLVLYYSLLFLTYPSVIQIATTIHRQTPPDNHHTAANQQITPKTEYSPSIPLHHLLLPFPPPKPPTPPLHLHLPPLLLSLPHLPTQPLIPPPTPLPPHHTPLDPLPPFPSNRHLPPRFPKRTHSSLALRRQHLFERHSWRDVREGREDDSAKRGGD